ncbi:hypothetical protein MTO96_025901 [Rhipicephalus appendiculatus]
MKAFDDSALEVAMEYQGSSDLGDAFSRSRTSTRDSSSAFGSDSRSVTAKHVNVTPSLTPVQESQSSLDALSQLSFVATSNGRQTEHPSLQRRIGAGLRGAYCSGSQSRPSSPGTLQHRRPPHPMPSAQLLRMTEPLRKRRALGRRCPAACCPRCAHREEFGPSQRRSAAVHLGEPAVASSGSWPTSPAATPDARACRRPLFCSSAFWWASSASATALPPSAVSTIARPKGQITRRLLAAW